MHNNENTSLVLKDSKHKICEPRKFTGNISTKVNFLSNTLYQKYSQKVRKVVHL